MSLYHKKTQESTYNEKMGGDFGQGDEKAEGILAKEGGRSGEGEEEKERSEAGGKKAVRERAEERKREVLWAEGRKWG